MVCDSHELPSPLVYALQSNTVRWKERERSGVNIIVALVTWDDYVSRHIDLDSTDGS
jgi:hypothetical protein